MTIFEDNELEVALVTYNRCPFVREWIENCYQEFVKRNISISIYDSSTNEETKELINELNSQNEISVFYKKVASDIPIGYKPMLPVLETKAKYLWVAGDSKYFSLEELEEKIFTDIKGEMDSIILCAASNEENDGKVYTEKGEFLRECFVSCTCIGHSIYKMSIFDDLKKDSKWMDECDRKYKNNYGFGWLGYFFEAFSKKKYTASFYVLTYKEILPELKVQHWAKRFYECWVENLCDLIEYLPENYKEKDVVPRETWVKIDLESHVYCHRARKSGGLSPEIFNAYIENGMLNRVATEIQRIKFYAFAPEWKVDMVFGIVQQVV